MWSKLLIYGANGYTGVLIAKLAAERGWSPVLAGRRAEAVEALARECGGLPWRAFGLDDKAALDAGLEGIAVVLHCAGPFSRTSRPMLDACLRVGAHYLDITGEVEVFEACAARHEEATRAGILVMPGVGFDVVPTDCLAAHLKQRLPTATHLELAFLSTGGLSHGTASTVLQQLPRGGLIRQDGRVREVPAAHRQRRFDFGPGKEAVCCMSVPWGDVSTAFHTTGIPNITVYMAAPRAMRVGARLSRWSGWLLGSAPVQRLAQRELDRRLVGPDEATRRRARSFIVGEAWDDAGRAVVSRLQTPEGYTLTAAAAAEIARRALEGATPRGFATPAMAFGPDFVLDLEGVARQDV